MTNKIQTLERLKTLYEKGKEKKGLEKKIPHYRIIFDDLSIIEGPSLISSEYKEWIDAIINKRNKMNELYKKLLNINKIPKNCFEKMIFDFGYRMN